MLPDLVKAFNKNTEPRSHKVTNVHTPCEVVILTEHSIFSFMYYVITYILGQLHDLMQ